MNISTPMSIMFWNARGIRGKVTDLRASVEHRKVDVVLLNETHLRDGAKFGMPNYVTYRVDRPKDDVADGGGGTAILVKRGIPSYSIACPALRTVEATAAAARVDGRVIVFCAVYNRPNRPIDTRDIDALLSLGPTVILAGDLNAKHSCWNSRATNSKGITLYNHMQSSGYAVVAPTEPTHFHHNGTADVLDVAVLKGVTDSTELWSLCELSSDHNPVLLAVSRPGCNFPLADVPLRKVTDWKLYSVRVEQAIDLSVPIESVDDLESELSQFERIVKESVEDASAVRRRPLPSWQLPVDILNLIKERNRVRKYWQKYRNARERARMNELSRVIKQRVAEHRDEVWAQATMAMTAKDKSLWKCTRRLTGTSRSVPALVDNAGATVSDPRRKAEVFADSLENQFRPVPPRFPEYNGYVEQFVKDYLASPDPSEATLVAPDQVSAILSRLNVGKAPGDDEISNLALKHLPRKGIVMLTKIFNAIYRLAHYPARWKLARVILIPKPGKALSVPSNYRPISLLSSVSKVFERTLLNELKLYGKPVDEQFGFRAGHCTTRQVLRLTEKITRGFNEHRHTGAVFLDIEKAFDQVWHPGLFYKLIYAKVKKSLIRLLVSYLEGRSFYVSSEGERSSARPIGAGVPQGSVVGPELFIQYVNDMPVDEDKALFADDTAIVAQSWHEPVVRRRLQTALDSLQNYFGMWRMKVNAQKCEAVLFTRKRVKPSGDIRFGAATIPWRSEARYLGVILDSKLNFRSQTKAAVRKATGQFVKLYPLLCNRSKLSLSSKRLLYKSFLRPVVTYASPAWAYDPTNLKRMQRFQSKMLRIVCDAHWCVRNSVIHRDLDMPTIDEFVRKLALRLYDASAVSNNPLIRALGDYDPDNPYNKYRRPKAVTR